MNDGGILRRGASEFIGTGLLLAAVVGSGIMGQALSGGSAALALLANSVATGASLIVLITIFGPVSGAHFNPAVTMVFLLRREIRATDAAVYAAAQITGGVLGVLEAHVMFAESLVQMSTKLRGGSAQGFSEFVATFGLIATIIGTLRSKTGSVPIMVGLYITSAYWFTASTAFANPAVTLARTLTNTFAGIAPTSAPLFIAAQLAGALAAAAFCSWLFPAGEPLR